MNKRFTLLWALLIVFVISPLYSQPQVSYIIPDIGAPAMNVYVEFVAPYNAKGTFGNDGVYLNNPGDIVRVRPEFPADAAKLKIGPVIVSWEGRLISTQVFVHPTLLPNSTDALILRPEFRIPLVVEVNGVMSNKQIFYIVKSRPYFDGSANPGALIFGEGALGLRSPRGAMIFDSLKLGNFTYNVSRTDCDPNTDGEQGFLPFTLLVRGKLKGEANTVISSNASGNHGGPGGGGGGGRYYDAFLLGGGNIGDDGGNGFVGGGAGGRNRNAMLGVSDAHKSQGKGTGLNGISLNNIPFPANQAYESAAGGTGHPFGLSGTSCSDGNNCNPPGGYGAGSGRPQNSQGGSAGYAVAGQGSSAGQPVGNEMNIPVAGGSGGASGNPNFPDAYSGNGGGGGGAMTIFGYEISNLHFLSKGANGGNPAGGIGNVSFGGSGSGGAVNILSKGLISNVDVNVSGGITNSQLGSAGRIRFDGFTPIGNPIVFGPTDASTYKGLSTDTSQFVKRTFPFSGTQAFPGKSITSNFYITKFDQDWVELSGMNFTDPPNGQWNGIITFPDNRPYLCLVAMQEVPNPKSGEYEREPVKVMSQAAANLFILDLNPILVADSADSNMAITCIGYERFIETEIKNDDLAGGNLQFNLSNNNWIFGNNGFEIVSPLGDIDLAPGQSIILKVRYFYTGGAKTDIMNSLRFNHNDPDPKKRNPWIIDFKVGDAYLPSMEFIGLSTDFEFPDTRIGGKNTKNIVLKNLGDADLRIESINPINPPFYVVGTDKPLPYILKPGDELRVIVEFRPTEEKDYTESLSAISIVTDTTCASFAFQPLKGKGVKSSIDYPQEIDFGLISWCSEVQDTIKILNLPGSPSFELKAFPVLEGDNPEAFVITNPTFTLPFVVTADDGKHFYIKINGKQAGDGIKKALFRIQTDIPELPFIEVVLKAEIIGFKVGAVPNPLNLGNVEYGFDINTSLSLRNYSKLPETLKTVTANIPANFTFPNVAGDVIDPLTGSYPLNFVFNTKNSANNEIIVIFDNPCDDTMRIPVIMNLVTSKESAFSDTQKFFTDTTVTDTLDFGKFSPCSDGLLKFIEYANTSEGRYIVLNEDLSNFGTGVFNHVGTGLKYPDTIPPSPNTKGGSQIFFNPANISGGIYYGQYTATIYINGNIVTRKIILKGEIIEGDYDYIPVTSNLSAVVGLSDLGELVINNKGPYNIEIIGFTTLSNSAFTLSGSLLGIVINSGSNGRTTVTFTPPGVGTYRDSVVVKILIGGCEEEFTFYINGEGMPSKKLKIYIPQMVVEPTINNFKIPIYGKLDKIDDSLSDFTIESLKITMRRSMFYPQSIIGGTLINSVLTGNDRVVEFKIDNVTVSKSDSIIAEIQGATLLGDVDFTDIVISDITYSSKALVSEITSENGSMRTEICSEGGDRLLKLSGTGSSISINPNPVSDYLGITAKSIEKGSHEIAILDILGNEFKVISWINPKSGEFSTIESYPADKLPAGNYVLKMKTPTEVITLPFVIMK